MSGLLREILIPFLIGGTIVSSVKFAATHMDNPALAAILGGLPTGLLSIYFLTYDKTKDYTFNYFFVTLILAFSIAVFYFLRTRTKLSKNVIWGIALGTWITLVTVRYFLVQHTKSQDTSNSIKLAAMYTY